MPVRTAKLIVFAELDGEEMLNFRHGKDLYPYCPSCEYSAYTPVTKVLGCTVGDMPEVIEFSDQVKQDPSIMDTQKCPAFSPRTRDSEAGFQNDAANASLKKEVPGQQIPSSVEDWQRLLHETARDLQKDPETNQEGTLLEEGLNVLDLVDHDSKDRQPEDYPQYNFFGDPNEEEHEKTALVADGPEVDESDDDEELYAAFDQAGMGEASTRQQQKQIATEVMTSWRDGLLAPKLTNGFIGMVVNDYNRSRGKTIQAKAG